MKELKIKPSEVRGFNFHPSYSYGSLDDKHRAELIKDALTVFAKYGIGFVAHALQYCGCADLHDPCDGRVSPEIGNLCFIRKDGTLRPYHEIYNEF